MRAKDYLNRLQKLDIMINQKIEELYSLQCAATKINANMDEEKVQTSKTSDVGNTIVHIIDLNNKINDEIDKFVNMKHKIINEIQELDNINHVKLLYKKYVQFKNFERIAVEMNYTYQYVIELHGHALKSFERTYKNLLKTYEGK